MKTQNTPLRLLATLLVAVGALSSASATTINWGTYISPTSYLFDSSGTNLDDNYVFELGSFGSFVPTAANMTDWLANWKPFDRATAPAGSGFDSATGTVAHSATLETDLTTSNTSLSQLNTFNLGEQAYIWIYKDTFGNSSPSPVYGTGLQWSLVTNNASDGIVADDWLFPAPSGHVSSTLDWRIEDATATPFGGLNNLEGAGSYTSTPADFVLQTHTVAAIPEPGSALLLLVSATLGIRARRRKVSMDCGEHSPAPV